MYLHNHEIIKIKNQLSMHLKAPFLVLIQIEHEIKSCYYCKYCIVAITELCTTYLTWNQSFQYLKFYSIHESKYLPK